MSIETIADDPGYLRLSEDQLSEIIAERVSESIDDVRASLRKEDVGWQLLKGVGDEDGGLTLEDLKKWSDKIRSAVIAAPWIKRGLGLRCSFIWADGGIKYVGLPKGQGKRDVRKLIDTPQNKREFFGKRARREREGRLYYDGFALWIGQNSTKTLTSIPLDQIDDVLKHPEFPGVIVAYLRKWKKYDFATGQYNTMKAYYIVNGYESLFDEVTHITPAAGANYEIKIEKAYTAFHMHANTLSGFAFGTPDALAAWIWYQIARDAYMNGVTMTEAMASIAFKATSKSGKGASNTALAMGRTPGAARTAALGGATDIAALSSAGKGYDFTTLRALTSAIATSLDVSNIALTADTSAAGSSYGAASTLDQPSRLAMEARRDEHAEFDEEVLTWMEAKSPKARFESLVDWQEQYRRLQAITMPWLQGIESEETYQEQVVAALGLLPGELGKIPDGVLLPNNEKSMMRPDVDADGQPTGTTPNPAQGKSNGTGGNGDNSNDIRQDQ